jgi:hypothetical protein
LSRASSLWFWSLLSAVIAGGLGVTINIATDLRNNLLAWILVGAFTVAAGVVSAGSQRLSQRKKSRDVSTTPPSADGTKVSGVDVRGNNTTVNISSGRGSGIQARDIQGGIHQTYVNGWLVALVIGVSCSVVAATLIGLNSASPRAEGDSQRSPTTPGDAAHALAASPAWPYVTGCASLAQVAMPPGRGRIQDFHAVTDIRPTLAASGAGSWTQGMLYLDLSTVDGQSIHIQNILPLRVRRDLASPAWIYSPDDGCGPPSVSTRVFSYDLDAGSFKDEGLPYSENGSVPPGMVSPTAQLGPGFVISGPDHALIEVAASSCRGNYEWNLDIQYVVTGTNTVEHYTAGPFQSYGVANNTAVYRGHQDVTGSIQIDDVSMLTGNDPLFGCVQR